MEIIENLQYLSSAYRWLGNYIKTREEDDEQVILAKLIMINIRSLIAMIQIKEYEETIKNVSKVNKDVETLMREMGNV